MTAPLILALAWLLFGGSHLLLSTPWVSARISHRLGRNGFVPLYASVATLSLLILGIAQMVFGGDGPAGPGLGRYPVTFWPLTGLAFLSAALMIAGLWRYPRSAMAQLARRKGGSLSPPRGPFRLSRHPFFIGLAGLMVAHAFLAQTLTSALFFAGFVLLSMLGLILQDRKLRQRHGTAYRDYEAATAVLPTPDTNTLNVAVLSSRAVLLPLGLAVLLALLHTPLWYPTNGAALAILIALFGNGAILLQVLRRKADAVAPHRGRSG